jgi:hypothetical protein
MISDFFGNTLDAVSDFFGNITDWLNDSLADGPWAALIAIVFCTVLCIATL